MASIPIIFATPARPRCSVNRRLRDPPPRPSMSPDDPPPSPACQCGCEPDVETAWRCPICDGSTIGLHQMQLPRPSTSPLPELVQTERWYGCESIGPNRQAPDR